MLTRCLSFEVELNIPVASRSFLLTITTITGVWLRCFLIATLITAKG